MCNDGRDEKTLKANSLNIYHVHIHMDYLADTEILFHSSNFSNEPIKVKKLLNLFDPEVAFYFWSRNYCSYYYRL